MATDDGEAWIAHARLDALRWGHGVLSRLVGDAADRETKSDAALVYTACLELVTGYEPRAIPGDGHAPRRRPWADEVPILLAMRALRRQIGGTTRSTSAWATPYDPAEIAAIARDDGWRELEAAISETGDHRSLWAEWQVRAGLTVAEAAVVALREGEHMRMAEIAERLDISRDTAYHRLDAAREKLRLAILAGREV